ncbi:MAG: AMP-binding protein [Bacteroidota bacterium]
MNPRTLPWLLESGVQKYGDNVLMLEKRDGAFVPSTYRQIQQRIHLAAAGLMSMGIQRGDRVGLISEGRNDWVVSELGILYAGGINVPLSIKIEEPSELKFRLAHSGCRMVIVSGTHAHKMTRIKKDLPDLEQVILLDAPETREADETSFDEVIRRGQDFLSRHRNEFDRRWQAVQEHDIATICYTSGTTADPKGVMLTHVNYVANVKQCSDHLTQPPWYCSLLILPWDHSFAHTAGVYLLMSFGASMASVQVGKTPMETLRNIPVNIREIKPTFLLSVPALAKNFRKNIEKGIADKGTGIERLFRRALAVAYAYNREGHNRGVGATVKDRLLYKLFDAVLFRKIRAGFGGRLDYFIGGAAVLDIELQRFFYAIGIPMYQGYGLTEAAPVVSANTPHKHKLASSGTIIPRLELRILDDAGVPVADGQKGQIVVKGENVMKGYWNNERATNEVLKDGWLYTGDIGYVDEDGYLFVLGREKSLLISSDGEKYSPEGIEEPIVAHSPYIDQVMLFNDHSLYTVALVIPNKDALGAWAQARRLDSQSVEGQDALLRLLEEQVKAYRAGGRYAGQFPERWLPSAIAVLGEGFTEQNRMLNSTLKMVRSRITEFYKNRIDYLFTPDGKDVCNHQNRTIVRRLEDQKS